jgi:hypothetical protein
MREIEMREEFESVRERERKRENSVCVSEWVK